MPKRKVKPKFVVRSEKAGLAAIRHPDIASNFERALKWRPRSKKAVLVPCAGTKPFYEAPSHAHGYLDALAGKDADLWIVSEPLGVVPYAWSDKYPNAHYDYPPRYLTGVAWDELVRRVARWLSRVAPKYERVFAALPGHHARLLADALAVHDPGNVGDVTHDACLRSGACPPGHGRATSTRYRSFLKRRVNPSRGADYDDLEAAETVARRLVAAAPGFADMADMAAFRVVSYSEEEVEDAGVDDRDWVGQYVKGSVDSPEGTVVLVRHERHEGQRDLTDTILHELGHALWELLDEASRTRWSDVHGDAPHGAEEEFADDFMKLVRGSTADMRDEALFRELAAT